MSNVCGTIFIAKIFVSLYLQNQGFLRTKVRTFSASYALVVIYCRCIKAALRECADRTHLHCRTRMILRTIVLN